MMKHPLADESLSAAQLQRVDELCQHFEMAWKQGRTPLLEAYLSEAAAQERASLFRELLWLEVHYRGIAAEAAEYESRFPSDISTVRVVFAEARKSNAAPAANSGNETVSQIRAADLGEGLSQTGSFGTGSEAPPLPFAAAWQDLLDHPRYRVLEVLGRGGMGTVFKAEHRLMERPVALKVIHPEMIANAAVVERFRREVKAVAQLTHANIVKAYDADHVGNTHILIMEYVSGRTLSQVVAADGPLPVALACNYVRQAALGLQHAFERGLVHRDIKPANLMCTPDGQIKILDLGLARIIQGNDTAHEDKSAPVVGAPPAKPEGPVPHGTMFTAAGTAMGTADYIAPEQARDARRPHNLPEWDSKRLT